MSDWLISEFVPLGALMHNLYHISFGILLLALYSMRNLIWCLWFYNKSCPQERGCDLQCDVSSELVSRCKGTLCIHYTTEQVERDERCYEEWGICWYLTYIFKRVASKIMYVVIQAAIYEYMHKERLHICRWSSSSFFTPYHLHLQITTVALTVGWWV